MYLVDVYLRIRRAVMVEGMSIREASRVFGLHRDTVRNMLAFDTPMARNLPALGIPGESRNPYAQAAKDHIRRSLWIPAFAGMTGSTQCPCP